MEVVMHGFAWFVSEVCAMVMEIICHVENEDDTT